MCIIYIYYANKPAILQGSVNHSRLTCVEPIPMPPFGYTFRVTGNLKLALGRCDIQLTYVNIAASDVSELAFIVRCILQYTNTCAMNSIAMLFSCIIYNLVTTYIYV